MRVDESVPIVSRDGAVRRRLLLARSSSSFVLCSFTPGSGTASLTELLVVLGDHLPLEGLCAWPLSQEGVADDLAPRDRVVVVVASSNLTRVEEVPELALSSSNWCCSWSLGSWRARGSWRGADGFLWREITSFSILTKILRVRHLLFLLLPIPILVYKKNHNIKSLLGKIMTSLSKPVLGYCVLLA